MKYHNLIALFPLYGKYRTAPAHHTLIAKPDTTGKWLDLHWVDPARKGMLVYVCSRPNDLPTP